MSKSIEGWKELVTTLEGLDDVLLDKLRFEIWVIQMERQMNKEESEREEGVTCLGK